MSGLRAFRRIPENLKEWARWCKEQDVEPGLGNPDSNGQVLSSDTDGNRDWVTVAGSDSFDGWNDITAEVNAAKVTGASQPTWAVFRDGVYAYEFHPTSMNECWLTFHVEHDYKYDSLVYPHVHFAPTTTATGTIRWGFEYTVSKGHDQAAFPASNTVYVEHTISSNKQYQHIVSEVDSSSAFSCFEPDALVLMRLFRDATHANDDFGSVVSVFTADLHYEVARATTPYRLPPFIR